MSPFVALSDRLRVAVRVTPRASRDAVAGVVADADGRALLAVRLTAPPVDSAANKALCSFLAKQLATGRSSVSIHSGQAARVKLVDIIGDPTTLAARIEILLR